MITNFSSSLKAMIVILFATLALAPTARALGGGGSVVGNGGGSLVCFTGDPKRFVEEGLLRPHAETAITSVATLEYFIASATGDLDPTIAYYAYYGKMSELITFLSARFRSAPDFSEQVRVSSQEIMEFNQILGSLLEPDYHDTHDWSSPVAFPAGCTRVQTAVRFGYILYYEPLLWSRLPEVQKLFLRYHEYIYYVGTRFSGMTSSRPTQDVLTYVLSKRFTPAGFRAKIKQAGFVVPKSTNARM